MKSWEFHLKLRDVKEHIGSCDSPIESDYDTLGLLGEICRRVRIDDDVPVTYEWMILIGAVHTEDDGDSYSLISLAVNNRVSINVKRKNERANPLCGHLTEWFVSGCEIPIACQPKTRGDVRTIIATYNHVPVEARAARAANFRNMRNHRTTQAAGLLNGVPDWVVFDRPMPGGSQPEEEPPMERPADVEDYESESDEDE